MRILFICKKNECYGFVSYHRRSSGLYNSTRFIVKGLKARGVHAEIIEVIDNNCIDRAVSEFKPDAVVIEALWVVPEKFDILKSLHPSVRWFVHMHSGLPFLALEGIAMAWLPEYAARGVGLIANSKDTFNAFSYILGDASVTQLPNVYISDALPMKRKRIRGGRIDIGCFGAVRPMKNHMAQAIAAIRFAESKGMRLNFHINASRLETGGEPVLKNIIELFKDHDGIHELFLHPWMEPEEFLQFLHDHIDIGMQVSMTETFNVVSADYVTAGIPMVVSPAVTWATRFCMADAESVEDMVDRLNRVMDGEMLVWWNRKLLHDYSCHAQQLWFDWARGLEV